MPQPEPIKESKHARPQIGRIDEGVMSLVRSAPKEPGCYLYLDNKGNVLYVGKAKNLAKRVRSYFTPQALANDQINEMAYRIASIEYETTNSELDALIREYFLIKQYKPWYNSKLKSDKAHPYLRVSINDPIPSLSPVMNPENDDALYFDHFYSQEDIRQVLVLFCKVWGLAQCGSRAFNNIKSPCLYHSLYSCMAPCSGNLDVSEYRLHLMEAISLFDGCLPDRFHELTVRMQDAARQEKFEEAAGIRDILLKLASVKDRRWQRFHVPAKGSTLVLIRPYRAREFTLFYLKEGRIALRQDFLRPPDDSDIDALIEALAGPDEVPYDDWLVDCLLEIGADKRFIVLDDESEIRQSVISAIDGYLAQG
ncbi:MAG: GIY-YIG nuclease family protein [Coriobacteriia bacterium]|nr:GIY-YIG nuclease family protein [Coriobacteriia bacterium]MCL2136658.1 GIY-YIG nuclease family protein [Coriobacteriia bacterium]